MTSNLAPTGEGEVPNMAGPGQKELTMENGIVPAATMATITRHVLDDTFYNIIHDIVAKAHREEKIARQTSAVVVAKQLADVEAGDGLDKDSVNGATEAGLAAVPSENNDKPHKDIRIETDAAVYADGVVRLKGNPMQTVKEIICPNCCLPRILHPGYGEGARRPTDLKRQYCKKLPPISMPGRDVNGNFFAVEKITKKKKNPPAQDPSGSSPPAPTLDSHPLIQPKQEKIYVPTTKCPNCPRYFLLTKSAQHLDRCLGISTRQSRTRTPLDSAVSTPAPQPAPSRKRARPDSEEETGNTKKRKEFNLPPKPKGSKPAGPSKLKNGTTADMLSAKPMNSTKVTSNGKSKLKS